MLIESDAVHLIGLGSMLNVLISVVAYLYNVLFFSRSFLQLSVDSPRPFVFILSTGF